MKIICMHHYLNAGIFFAYDRNSVWLTWKVISGRMENNVCFKISNLESQIEELTDFVAGLLKNQKPSSLGQEPQTSPQANQKSSYCDKQAPASTAQDL